ncbi:MAG: hypothetical protein ACYC3W_12185 [Candidatus Nanopelagicales bacterium]
MKIVTTPVEKIRISGIPNQDPIYVFVEDFGPRFGRVTITCFDDAWSYWGGGLPDNQTMAEFFIKASNDYLVCNFASGIRQQKTNEDVEVLHRHLERRICEARFHRDIKSAVEARSLFDSVPSIDYSDTDALYEILGDDWHLDLPKEPNPQYDRLSEIVSIVQEALKTKREERAPVAAKQSQIAIKPHDRLLGQTGKLLTPFYYLGIVMLPRGLLR